MEKWLEMTLTCEKSFLPHLTGLLMSKKIMKWAEEDENGNVHLKIYFPYFPEIEENIDSLRKYLDIEQVRCVTREIEDEDWAYSWQRFFEIERVGERIVIKPPWKEYRPEDREIILEIEPRMAFGSGYHPTTKLTLMLAEKYIKPGMNVLDMGCGSGILTIMASYLKAERATAVDHDEIAVKEALRNIGSENLKEKGFNTVITTKVSNGFENVDEKFDVIMINVFTDFVTDNLEEARKALNPGGFLLTGSVEEESKGMRLFEEAEKLGFRQIEKMELNGWTGLALQV